MFVSHAERNLHRAVLQGLQWENQGDEGGNPSPNQDPREGASLKHSVGISNPSLTFSRLVNPPPRLWLNPLAAEHHQAPLLFIHFNWMKSLPFAFINKAVPRGAGSREALSWCRIWELHRKVAWGAAVFTHAELTHHTALVCTELWPHYWINMCKGGLGQANPLKGVKTGAVHSGSCCCPSLPSVGRVGSWLPCAPDVCTLCKLNAYTWTYLISTLPSAVSAVHMSG